MVVPASFVVNFIHRLTELYNNGRNYEVKIYMLSSTVIDRARNHLVRDALKDGCDYIMFIDADMLLPPNAVDNLIDMNVGIASGLYFTKGKPYLPVARVKKKDSYSPEKWDTDDDHRYLETFEFNKIMKVAAVGMGCCLIKSEIFRKLEYPWFKFEWKKRDGNVFQLAEDLYFCENALKEGYDTYLNTGIVCEHFGTEVGASHFLMYRDELKKDKVDREDAIECLMKLDNISEEEVHKRFTNRIELRNKEWEKVDKSNTKSVEDYYVNNNYEIYDHFHWHLNKRRPFDKKIVETIKRLYPNKSTEILDFGCGGGQVAFMLAKEGYIVTTYEPNKKCNDFISLRFKKNKCKVKKLIYPLSEQIKNKYDVILCFDVLEHVSDEKFEETMNLLGTLKKPGGEILSTMSFGAQDRHPMHYDLTPEKEALLKKILRLDK